MPPVSSTLLCSPDIPGALQITSFNTILFSHTVEDKPADVGQIATILQASCE